MIGSRCDIVAAILDDDGKVMLGKLKIGKYIKGHLPFIKPAYLEYKHQTRRATKRKSKMALITGFSIYYAYISLSNTCFVS